jgi:protease I
VIPVKALRMAGADVDIVSLHGGKIRGVNVTAPSGAIAVDRTVDDVEAREYDALFVPGGFVGPDLLRQSREARDLVRSFDEARKPIATLCHGPWLLVSADLVGGRAVASWPGIRDDVVNAGGIYRDEPVVRDANWLSSRGPHDLAAFVPAMIELFASGTTEASEADVDDVAIVSSPRADAPSPLIVGAARALPGPGAVLRMIAGLAALAAVGMVGMLAMRRAPA